MEGKTLAQTPPQAVLFDTLYPMAMLPARSRARLGMKRLTTLARSGSQVVPCRRLGATGPPVTFAWYQRGAASPGGLARRTGWGIRSDSWPPEVGDGVETRAGASANGEQR